MSEANLNSINVIKITLAVFNNLIDQSLEYANTFFHRHEIYFLQSPWTSLNINISTNNIGFNQIFEPKLYMDAHLFVLYEFFVQEETLPCNYWWNTFRY